MPRTSDVALATVLACSACEGAGRFRSFGPGAVESATPASPPVERDENGQPRAARQKPTAKPVLFADFYPEAKAVRPGPWLERHGVAASVLARFCWDLGDRVGVPPSAGLLCVRDVRPPEERIATIYRVEQRRLSKVWQGTIATTSSWLGLTPLLSEDGGVLELRDRTIGECESTQCEHQKRANTGYGGDFGEVLSRGCRGVGSYEWRSGKYVTKPTERTPGKPCSEMMDLEGD